MDQEKSASAPSFSPSGHGEEKESRNAARQMPRSSGTVEERAQEPAPAATAPEALLRTSTSPQWRTQEAEQTRRVQPALRQPRSSRAAKSGHVRFPFLRREREKVPQPPAEDTAQPAEAGEASDKAGGAAGTPSASAGARHTTQEAALQAAQQAAHLGSNIAKGMGRLSHSNFLQGKTWYFLLSVNILLAVVLSLILVWVSIERMDINYFINIERVKLRDKQSLHGKLMVEKERLLSPYELRVKAEKLGMKAPKPGQIRRIDMGHAKPAKKGS